MDVLDLPIRLVVKAPNQQIDDQVIECAITWTVKKLKTYLSEVYPSKPNAEDQKLIYSGQLLPDNLMLKDILRQYDTEVVHTVHLVCMPPKETTKSSSTQASPATSGSPRMDSSPTPNSNNNNNSDGLRHRNTVPTNNTTNPEQRSQQGQPVVESRSTTFPNSNGLTPEQLNQQMAWMRMYGQYMNYYMQQYQGIYGVNLPGVQPQVPISAPEVQPVAEAGNQNPENIREGQLNEIRRMNAQGGPVDDDDELGGNRDWLDWVYVFSRLSVLFAIVYFYSSFNRFVMVVLFAVLLYMYQTGVFWRRDRLQRANNNNNNPRVVENPPIVNQDVQEQPQAQEEQDMEQMQRETRELEETMDRDTEPNNRVTQQTVSFLYIAWTFVATFFSSLLPQQQEAVNLN